MTLTANRLVSSLDTGREDQIMGDVAHLGVERGHFTRETAEISNIIRKAASKNGLPLSQIHIENLEGNAAPGQKVDIGKVDARSKKLSIGARTIIAGSKEQVGQVMAHERDHYFAVLNAAKSGQELMASKVIHEGIVAYKEGKRGTQTVYPIEFAQIKRVSRITGVSLDQMERLYDQGEFLQLSQIELAANNNQPYMIAANKNPYQIAA
jgi:hypothetical protein